MEHTYENEYYEGVAAYPLDDCPYSKLSTIGAWCAWWAGWQDARRGMV